MTVGALTPSSRFLARRMVSRLDWEPGVRIVEFGPGTGPFTREILDRLPAGGRYLGIERDAAFVGVLRRRFPGADFACDSVENLDGILTQRSWDGVDHIVSGLPFASLSPAVIRSVLDAAAGALDSGGTFTTFQYMHAYYMPSARVFRREVTRRFSTVSEVRVELRNVPPAFIFTWTKP